MSLGVIYWSPDYQSQKTSALPVPDKAHILLTHEERRLIEEFRRLRPGQVMTVSRDAQGRFWRTALDDVTEDPV